MPPIAPAIPRVLLNGAASAHLSRDLTSLRVHVVRGFASAQIIVASPLGMIEDLNADDVETNSLEIHLQDDEEFFSGTLTAIETRLLSDAGQRTILLAEGMVPDATAEASIPLRFGADLSWVSVRREPGRWAVEGMCSVLELRPKSRVDVLTDDSAFDGQFRVTELRYRFDTASGATVEFIAEDEPP